MDYYLFLSSYHLFFPERHFSAASGGVSGLFSDIFIMAQTSVCSSFTAVDRFTHLESIHLFV